MTRRCLPIALVLAALAGAAPAHAAPCTNTYVGPRFGGDAARMTSWSRHVLPGPDDHVCFPHRTRLEISGGGYEFRSIHGLSALVIDGGTLVLTDATRPTVVPRLAVGGPGPCAPTLGGAATVLVTHEFRWLRNGAMLGGGETILGVGSRGVIDPGPWRSVFLLGRRLTNKGTLRWTQGSILSGGEIVNDGYLRISTRTGRLTGYDTRFGLSHAFPFAWPAFSPCVHPAPAGPVVRRIPDARNV